MKKRILSIILCILMLTTVFSDYDRVPARRAEAASVLTNSTSSRTKQEIINKYTASRPTFNYSNSVYQSTPSIAYPYSGGSLKSGVLTDTLNELNFYRWLAGVSNVSSISSRMEYNQAGSVLMAKKNQLAHSLDRPSDMDTTFYDKASQGIGASKSSYYESSIGKYISWSANCACGQARLCDTILDYANDKNVSNIGHRLSILDYTRKAVSFGYTFAQSSSVYSSYSCLSMYNYPNETQNTSDEYYAWPAAGYFPVEAISSDAVWSIRLGSAYSTTSSLNATLTYNGTSYSASVNASANTAYNAFTITPSASLLNQITADGRYKDGVNVTLNVSGIKETSTGSAGTISHTVRFFVAQEIKPTSVNVYQAVNESSYYSTPVSNLTLNTGDTCILRLVYSPTDCTNKGFTPSYSTSGVVSCSEYTAYSTSLGVKFYKLTASNAGTTTVTFRSDADSSVSKSFTVTVNAPHTHDYSTYVSTTNGVATFRCSCGATTTKTVPTTINVYRVVGSTNSTLASSYTMTVGDTFDFKVYSFSPSGAVFGDMKVKITSGSSYISYTETSSANRTGRFTMTGAGTATVKIYPEYNEAAAKTVTFTINPAHTHNYSTYVSTTNGVATFRCSCGETTTKNAPTSITVYKVVGSTNYILNSAYTVTEGDTFDFKVSSYLPSDAVFGDMKVKITSGSSYITYSETSSANRTGRFTMKAAGTATVKIYPEYNEAAGKTITFTINPAHTHNYSTYVSTTNGVATLRCSCGETTTVTAPATITVYKMSGNSGISVDSSYNMIIGDTFDFMLSCSPSSAQQGQLKVVIQNSSVISYTASSTANNRGTLTMLSAGTTTVKIYPEYNPSESKTITFTVTPPHTHDYTFVSLTDGIATVRCSCGDEMQVNAPTTQSVYFYRNGSSVSAKSLMEGVIGEVYDIYTYAYPSGSSEGAIAVEISNPSVASFEKTTQTRGKLTLLSKGTTTVRVYQKYNPEVYNEYTFDVDTHAHNYVWQSTENNVATFKCSTCNKEKQENAPTSLSPYMYLGSTYVSLSGGEVKLESYKLYYSVGSNYDLTKACDVTISDSSIATFTPVSNSYGNIEFVNTGEVTVTISVKYNPTVKRTYTLYASNCEHDYKWNRTVDNVGISKCSNCGHEKNMSVPTSMYLYRVENGSNYSLSTTSSFNKKIGDTFDFIVSSFYPSSAPTGRLMVDISDDSIVSYTPASEDESNREGTFTMLAGGTATVRIYPEYNEGIAKTITFNVHKHDYTFVSMEDGVATVRCSCGEEKQVTAPTYQSYSVYKYSNGKYEYPNSSGITDCLVGDVYNIALYAYPTGTEGAIGVEISNPSVASFEKTGDTNGKLTMLSKGITTVKLYQKYNPSVKIEFTFDADTHEHSYVWQGTENNIATFKCTTCNKERQVDAPTYLYPYFYIDSTYTGLKTGEDVGIGSYTLYYSTNNSGGMAGGIDVSISDESLAQYTSTSATGGRIEFLNTGEVTITISAKYNPSVTKTYTLYASNCEHDYSWNRTVDNVGIARCSLCGHEKNMSVPTTMNLYRVENGGNYWISDSYSYNKNIGDTFSFKVTSFNPSSAPTGRLMVDISDDSIVSYTPASEDDSNREGTLAMLAGGTATVRIYPEYNEGIAKTITFNVHEHSYEWYSTTDDVATLKCSCGDTKQINVPTAINVGWKTGASTYTSNVPSEEQEINSTLTLNVPVHEWGTIDNGVNKEIVVEISDTDVVSFTLEKDEWSGYEGTLTMLATGSATVKVYPKYNPEIAKTFTFNVVLPHEHDYEFVSITDGMATIRCACGEEMQVKVPRSQRVNIKLSGQEVNSSLIEAIIGEVYNINLDNIKPNDSESTMAVDISDPSVVSFEATGQNTGKLTMLTSGTTTVRVYQKYNPNVYSEYTFDVDTHTHDYEWQGTENNIATFKCSICDKVRKEKAPSYINLSWFYLGYPSSTSVPDEYDVHYGECELIINTDVYSGLAGGFDVSLSDNSIATYRIVQPRYVILNFGATGDVTVTITPKYNPSVKRVCKFYSSNCQHDYKWNRTVDNVGIARCSVCGHEKNMEVPYGIDLYETGEGSYNYLYNSTSSFNKNIGDTFSFRMDVRSSYNVQSGRMMVDISDSSIVSYTPASEDDSNREGTFTMLAGGTAVVNIYPEYNAALAKTLIFNVHEHNYEFVSIEDGMATIRCSCGEEKQVTAPKTQYIQYLNTAENYYYDLKPEETIIGKEYIISASVFPNGCEKNLVVEISDPSVASYEATSDTKGKLTMLAKGTTTVRFYQKYNPSVYNEYTFDVDTHVHNYEWQGTENGVATFKCSLCDKEKQSNAPTYISPSWYYDSSTYVSVRTEDDVKTGSYRLYFGGNNLSGMAGGCEVEISDSNIATFTQTSATSGIIEFTNSGNVTITIYAKYNPTVRKTYTLYASDCTHEYEWQGTENNIATFRCSLCEHEKQVNMPAVTNASWKITESSSTSVPPVSEQEIGAKHTIIIYRNNDYDDLGNEYVVEISDDEIISCVSDLSESWRKSYELTMLKPGTATVTVYPKYNPEVAKTFTFTVLPPHEHDYTEWTGTEEGMATFECECGETTQIAVPTSISVSRNDGNEAGELASAYELTIGDTLGFKLTGYAPADTLFGSMVVKTSDESVVSYTPASEDDDNTEGTLTMHAAGSATVKIYPYYNEAAAKTITFTVLPHEEHDYQFVSARKGIATWRCICGDERQIAVPTSQTVTVQNGTTYWEPSNYEEGLECVVGDVCDISIKCYPANVENIVCVEISDPSIASYEATGNSTGRLKLNSKGVVCVTFSQKYDPDMRKTAYFYVDDHAHDYVLQSVEEGYAVIICSICDRERHVNVPSSMGICWYDSQDNDLNIQDEADIEIGRYKINVYTDFLPHLGDEHVVEISDSSIATFTYDSDKSGTIEFVKGGTVTVTIYLKYNPSVRKTYTLTVYDPHEHDYQYSYTNEYGYAIFTCECGETEAVRVPSYVYVGWYDEEGDSYESSPAVTWETGMQTEFIYSFYPSIYESNDVNTEFVINISNPDVMSIEECGDAENGDYRYKVNMLAQGETTLTIYPKYNPDLAQTFNFTVIQHEHDYSEWTGTADGVATFKCECGKTTQVSVPTSITVDRVDERGLYVPIEESYECLLEDTLEIYTVGYSPSNTRFGRMIVDISDSSIVSYTPQSTHESNRRGTLTMLAGGTATVRVYPEFNEAAAVSFDITVIPHKHDYELVSISESGTATIRCNCGDEKQVIAPYSQWSSLTLENRTIEAFDEFGFDNNLIGDVYDITTTVYSYYCEALNVVEISDPSVASYEATGKTSGKLTLLAKGTTTVRIYQRYNPSLSEEFTFEVDDHIHDYVWQGTQNNYATFKCSICDKVRETYIPDNITSSMYDKDAYFYDIQRENDVKKKIYTMYTYFDEYDGLAGGFNVEVSDNSIATYTAESMQSGTIEFIDNGEVTVTFTAKYNPDAIRTYKFYVSDCEHEYEVVNAENDIVYLRCGLCGHEREDDLTLEPALSLRCDDDNFEAAPHNIIMNKGDFINYRLTHNYLHDEYIVTSDDSDVVYIDGVYEYGYFPEYEGSFNAENEGSAVITIINKNCPSISCTYNITVLGESNLPEFKISRATLKLENNISIVFKADAKLAEVYHDMYIEVEQEIENGQKIKKRVDGTLSADGSFYEFVYTGVNAKAVGDNLDITIFGYDAEGNLIQGGTKTGYSVKQYCMSMLSKDDDYFTSLGFVEEKTSALRTLLVDLLNYASEAQKYFEYKTDSLANAELSEEQQAYASDDSVLNELINVTNLRQETVSNPQAQWKAASVVLKSKTGIRVKFTYAGNINDIAIVAKPENGTEMRITEFEECGENTYYAYYNELNAYQFDESVDFVVVSGSEKISNTLRYSVESYAARKISSANLEDVVSAMIKYGKSAKVYAFGDFKKTYNANTEEKLIIE